MIERDVAKLLSGLDSNNAKGFEFTSNGIYLRGKVTDRGEKILYFVVLGEERKATPTDTSEAIKRELERRGMTVHTYSQGSMDNLDRTARPEGWVIGGHLPK